MLKNFIIALILGLIVLWSVGCQTVAGFGGDIKWTAEATADLLNGE
jgi:predicted small secreted protein